jgi:hypothetical protein
MKTMLNVCLKKLLPLACVVCMLSGCLEAIELTLGVADFVGDIADAATASARARERAKEFSKGGENPFTNPAEDRLTRRTSALAGGIPVDVSPYMLHGNSFAIAENGIQRYQSILELTKVYDGGKYAAGNGTKSIAILEYDIAVTFEANNQSYQMNATAATCGESNSKIQSHIKAHMKEYAAQRYGLDSKAIKNFKVQFLKARKGKSNIGIQFSNVFVQDIEPGYFQFDVEVEYQKKSNYAMGLAFKGKTKPEHFDIFNKVYRSDLTSAPAATIEVQSAIWKDAVKSGFKATPLPIINFVKVVRVKQ